MVRPRRIISVSDILGACNVSGPSLAVRHLPQQQRNTEGREYDRLSSLSWD